MTSGVASAICIDVAVPPYDRIRAERCAGQRGARETRHPVGQQRIVPGIITQEQGRQPFSSDLIRSLVREELGGPQGVGGGSVQVEVGLRIRT